MLANLNPKMRVCQFTPRGTLRLPVGRLSYPSVFKARTMPGETDQSKAKFSTSVILPAEVDLSLAHKWIKDLAVEKWGDKPTTKIKNPILNHADKTADSDLAAEFPILIRCSSEFQPEVLFGNGDTCTAQQSKEVYPGRWAWVTVRGYAWEHPMSGKGVSFGLSNIVLLDHDDALGGSRASASDEFADVFSITSSRDPDSMFADKPSSLFD